MNEKPMYRGFQSKRGKLWEQSQERMSTSRSNVRYRSIMDAVKAIWKEEGILGFFKGVKMRMMIQSVSSGIGWGTYQLVKGLSSSKMQH